MPLDSFTVPLSRNAASRCAAQHFGAWAIEPRFAQQQISAIRSGMLKPKMPQPKADFPEDDEWEDYDDEGNAYEVRNGVAIITLSGQMTKGGSSFGGCSTIETRKAVRAAAKDTSVKAILLHICSPGGTVSGTADLAEDVNTAKGIKPTHAFISDLGCSAAYWVASQCDSIQCNVTALVGSIGTYTVLEDDTGLQEQIGIKSRTVSTGTYKGLGADGKVSDELVADVQREVDELNAPFLAAVIAGRGDKVDIAAVSDGRAHVGGQAKSLGLVDEVSTVDAMLAAISQEIGTMPITASQFAAHAAENPQAAEVLALVQQGYDKAKADAAPKPATLAQLKASFGGDDTFILAQLEACATMEAANAAAVKVAKDKLAARDAELATVKQNVAKAAGGTPPIPEDTNTTPAGEVTAERKAELLGMTNLGRGVLALSR